MNDYKVTRLVTSLGYVVGFISLALFTVLGYFLLGGVKGIFGGFVIGAFATVPGLMFCEMMHAIVTIANNSKPENKIESKRDNHAA